MKKEIIVLTASSLLIGTLGFVGAQSTQSGGAGASTQSRTQTQSTPQTKLPRGFGHGFGPGDDFGRGFGGLPFGRHLALGTTVKLEFYTTDPSTASGGTSTPQKTLNFTYGQDSEAAFAQNFAAARANAGFVVVNVGEQTQTLALPSNTSNDTSNSDSSLDDRHGGAYGALPLRDLNEGSSVKATFYDGDPAGNAKTLQTLNFTYGQDSEAGFAADFAAAAKNAAFVTITTSPQTYTVNLSQTSSGRGDMGSGGERGGLTGQDDHRGGPGGRR